MKTRLITLELPGGSSSTIEIPSGGDDSNLADFLEARGYRLNTRCGGRGLCRGCQVSCQTNSHSESLRSCQTAIHALPDESFRLIIPKTSWHDQTLHGVSFFEIHLPDSILRRQSEALALAIDIGTTTLAGPCVIYRPGSVSPTSRLPIRSDPTATTSYHASVIRWNTRTAATNCKGHWSTRASSR